MNILVTGNTGFIGSHLIDRLLTEENKVVAIDNLSLGNKHNIEHHLSNEKFNFVEGDILNKELLDTLFENNNFDFVFHLAANSDTRRICFLYIRRRIMIKMVSSDLDGTLLTGGSQTIPEEIFSLIKELKDMGILFVAASGRQYANMRNLFLPVRDDMAFISENGGLAIQNEKLLYCDSFDKDLVMEIIEAIHEKKDAEFSCSTKDFYYIMPKTEHYRHLMVEEVKNQCRIIESLDEITDPCMKVAVYERNGMTEESIRYWKERFGDRCTVVTWICVGGFYPVYYQQG